MSHLWSCVCVSESRPQPRNKHQDGWLDDHIRRWNSQFYGRVVSWGRLQPEPAGSSQHLTRDLVGGVASRTG